MRKTILAAVVVVLAACSGKAEPAEDACAEATAALERFDSDPSTPDNIEPTAEDFAAFSEAYERAEAVCSPGG